MAFRPNWYENERGRRSFLSGASSWSGFRWVLTLTCMVFALQLVVESAVLGDPTARHSLLTRYGGLRAWIFDPNTGGLDFNWAFPVQLVSYALLHDGFMHLAFNLLALWVFSMELEAWMGRRAYLRLYIFGAVVGGLLQWGWWVFSGSPGSVIGASGAVYAVMVLSALKWPHRTLLIWGILPVPVWLIAGLYVVNDFSALITQSAGSVAVLAHLGGGAFALLWYLKGDVVARAGEARKRHVVARERAELDSDRREMDRILAKIQANGLNSLDGSERAFLERRSRELRERPR